LRPTVLYGIVVAGRGADRRSARCFTVAVDRPSSLIVGRRDRRSLADRRSPVGRRVLRRQLLSFLQYRRSLLPKAGKQRPSLSLSLCSLSLSFRRRHRRRRRRRGWCRRILFWLLGRVREKSRFLGCYLLTV